MVIDEILNIRWKCIYPLYFDKKRSITEGRRVPQGQSITNPTCQHLIFACEGLNLPISVEKEKRHPRDPLLNGRIRVQLYNSTGELLRPDIMNTRALLRFIAERLPEAMTRYSALKTSPPSPSSLPPAKASTEVSGMTLVPRKKKGKK